MPKPITAEQFWAKAKPRPSGCWEWQGYTDRNGYGHLTVLQRYVTAHRRAWELAKGPIHDGLCVLHRCDNPSCINPDHLFLGTQLDNIADCNAKGRASGGSLPGERNPVSKLTSQQAIAIFQQRRILGRKLREVAADFGITTTMVWLIAAGQKWESVTRGMADANPAI